MTLNGRNVTLAEIKQFYGAHHTNFNKDRSILSAAQIRGGSSGWVRQIQYMLPYTCVRTASAV